ncbi:MAG TPA: hypothetical protein VFV92_10470 [Candidatus Bathyarchaeia archaeon]|nr:hypothetical protein [Candidatus Bathyarchaeia archaeon]
MSKLKIQYVNHLPHGAEDLPMDVVELWVSVFGRKVDVNVVRRGFILADPVMRTIRQRINRLAVGASDISRPLVERIGFSPELSPEWRQFLEELLQKDDSWSFIVNPLARERPS